MNGDEIKFNILLGFRVRVLGLFVLYFGSFCNVWVLGEGGCGFFEKCSLGSGRVRRVCFYSWSVIWFVVGVGFSGRKKVC